MPRCIMKLTSGDRAWYLEWSTVVDAPVTFGASRKEFEAYYQRRYGTEGMRDLPERMARADEHGTSWINPTAAEETIAGNRAGPGESELTMEEIVRWYCVERRDPFDTKGQP